MKNIHSPVENSFAEGQIKTEHKCESHHHVSKHVTSKKSLLLKEARETDIVVAMSKYDEETHPRGETLPEEQCIYQTLAFF